MTSNLDLQSMKSDSFKRKTNDVFTCHYLELWKIPYFFRISQNTKPHSNWEMGSSVHRMFTSRGYRLATILLEVVIHKGYPYQFGGTVSKKTLILYWMLLQTPRKMVSGMRPLSMVPKPPLWRARPNVAMLMAWNLTQPRRTADA